jgi:hypothetical protein
MRRIEVLVVALALLASGCGGDPAPFQAAVDGLSLPSTWQITKTVVEGGPTGCLAIDNPNCPSVFRYYSVRGDLPDLFQQAETAIVAEGYGELQELFPSCDLNTDSSPCGLTATKDDIKIAVDLYRPGRDVDSLGISVPDRAIVRMIVRPN